MTKIRRRATKFKETVTRKGMTKMKKKAVVQRDDH